MGPGINLLFLLLAGLSAWLTRFGKVPVPSHYMIALLSGLFLAAMIFPLTGAFRSEVHSNTGRSFRRLAAGWLLVFFLLALVAVATKTSENYSRLWFGYWLIYGLIGIAVGSWCQCHFYLYLQQRRWQNSKILLIGTAGNLTTILNKLEQRPNQLITHEYRENDGLKERLKQQTFKQIWVATGWDEATKLQEILHTLGETPADIRVIPDLFQFQMFTNRPVESLGIPMIELTATDMAGSEAILKSLFDSLSASMLLILMSPVYLLIMLAIKLDSPGPVHFKQQRLGFSGESITILKFRSMQHSNTNAAAVATTQAAKNDPRVTRFGHFLRRSSLDELPQLINVILGQMSLVGPRPHAQTQNEHFRDLIPKYMLRHKVKPGMTGWAQINGFRGETDTLEKMNKRIEYDLWYIRNWSLWLDITILLRTPMAVIKGNNAY